MINKIITLVIGLSLIGISPVVSADEKQSTVSITFTESSEVNLGVEEHNDELTFNVNQSKVYAKSQDNTQLDFYSNIQYENIKDNKFKIVKDTQSIQLKNQYQVVFNGKGLYHINQTQPVDYLVVSGP